MKNRKNERQKARKVAGFRRTAGELWVIAFSVSLLFAPACGDYDAPTGPQTRTVSASGDAEFRSIQECISASNNGDRCRVGPGTYQERINFQGKAITVRSSRGPDRTRIDGRQRGTVVTFSKAEGANSVLDGFTIMNGLAVASENSLDHGGGILMLSASPVIRNCILLDNEAEGDGGGIYCFTTGSRPVIQNVVFAGNTANGQGGGLCAVYGTPDLINCLFFDNRAARGGAISSRYGTSLDLANCTFAENSASLQAGVLYLLNASATLTNSISFFNSSPLGHDFVMDRDPEQRDITRLSLEYVNLQGGIGAVGRSQTCSAQPAFCPPLESVGILNADPLFVSLEQEVTEEDPIKAFYLSQRDAEQPATSPCVDAGDRSAKAAGLDGHTTRTDGLPDQGIVDLGYHYDVPPPTP